MVEINLLPWRQSLRSQKKKTRWLFGGVTGIIFLLIAIGCYVVFIQQTANKQQPVLAEKNNDNVFLQQIKFIGYLHQEQRKWGIVLLPNGKTQEVQTGTWLADFHICVVFVSEKEMKIAKSDKGCVQAKTPLTLTLRETV